MVRLVTRLRSIYHVAKKKRIVEIRGIQKDNPSLINARANQKAPRLREGLQGEGREPSNYFAGAACWSVAGAEPEARVSRLFFRRLISTRPPLVCFAFVSAASAGTGALPIPTR